MQNTIDSRHVVLTQDSVIVIHLCDVENNVRPRRSPRTVRVASMNAALEEEIELDIVWSKPWVIEMAFEGGFYQYISLSPTTTQ